MIPRDLEAVLRQDAARFPVLTLLGPRQSGKSTLVRAAFPDLPYVNLERPDRRAFAVADPLTFLRSFPDGAVFDEVQRVPELLSWIQVEVDERPTPGRFVLTGSNQTALGAVVSQSLAGRTSVRTLLPPSLSELRRFPHPPPDLWTMLWMGAFPRIHDAQIPPDAWLPSYVATYVERDVRQLLNIVDLSVFMNLVTLMAARTSQEVNFSSLGSDAGVTQPTARAWMSVLEASYLVWPLSPWHDNLRKRIVKASKFHVVDTGLVASLLGIHSAAELRTHSIRGPLFESWVAVELIKQRLNRGRTPRMFHLRETRGLEVDLVVDDGDVLWLIEVKSGATVAADWFGPLLRATEEARERFGDREVRPALVYGGDDATVRHGVRVVPWLELDALAPA